MQKMYLIELIQAKKFKSQTEVDNIIHRVKLERLQISRAKRESRRRRLQVHVTLINMISIIINIFFSYNFIVAILIIVYIFSFTILLFNKNKYYLIKKNCEICVGIFIKLLMN